jgi:hypothetical protein
MLGKTKIVALLLGVVLLMSQVNVHNGNVNITFKFWCIFCLLALPVTMTLREKNSVVEPNRKKQCSFFIWSHIEGMFTRCCSELRVQFLGSSWNILFASC